MPTDSVDIGAYPWPLVEPLSRYGVKSFFDLIHGPTIEPILLGNGMDDDGVKTHLRVRHNREDDYISRLIKVARQQCEYETGRALVPQTWALVMDKFPRASANWGLHGLGLGEWAGTGSASPILIEKPPVISVQEITYYDMAGTIQSLDITDAFLQIVLPRGERAGYGRLRPIPNLVWPDTQSHRIDAVRIVFQAGYADSQSPPTSPPTHTVPDALIAGMLMMIGELYKTREMGVNAISMPTPLPVRRLWAPFRVY